MVVTVVVFHGQCGPFVFLVMVEGEGKGGRHLENQIIVIRI